MAQQDYEFRRLTTADLPLLRRWLMEPHVREWWGDPVRGLETIGTHLSDSTVDLFVVAYQGLPIGYLQCWDPHGEADHPCRDQPPGTRGIDQFIGEAELVGHGHGSAFIRAFTERTLKAGAPRVITDPNPRNARAIRAYAKAGFRLLDHRLTFSGEALLMARDSSLQG